MKKNIKMQNIRKMRKITHKPNARGLDQLDTSPQVLKAATLLSGSQVMPTHAQGHFERYKSLTRFGIRLKEKGDRNKP